MLATAATHPLPPANLFGPHIVEQIAVSAQTLPIHMVPQPGQTIRGDNDLRPNQFTERRTFSSKNQKKDEGEEQGTSNKDFIAPSALFLAQLISQSDRPAEEVVRNFFSDITPEPEHKDINIKTDDVIPFQSLARDFISEEAAISHNRRVAEKAFSVALNLIKIEATNKEGVSLFT